jgi:hypothetical protein
MTVYMFKHRDKEEVFMFFLDLYDMTVYMFKHRDKEEVFMFFLVHRCDCLQIQMKRQMRHVCLVSYFLFVYNLYKGNENVCSITCNCLII